MTATHKDSSVLRWTRAKVVEIFGADLRSLATFRIVLALLVLADLLNRATDLSAHYTDEGLLPRPVLLEEVLHPWMLSLNLIGGEPSFQALLFGVAALAALGLLVGYRTRAMTIVLWMLLLSIQFRNPLISGAGEPLLRLMLFWAMFLPLGAIWSVDRARKAVPPRLSMHFLSLATAGLFFQIAFMYWFTAILKSGEEWRVDGTALYYALSYDQVAKPMGVYLLNFPTLLEVMTFATLALEAFGPFLFFCPIFFGPVRTAAVLAFMSLHAGIWLTMDIGIFPLLSACLVCFLPGWFWDNLAPKLRAALPRRLAGLALHLRHTAVRAARAYYWSLGARLSPTAGLAARGTDHAAPLITGEKRPSQATRARAEAPHGPGNKSTMLRSSLATNLLAGFFLVYIFCWNLTTVSSFTIPERLKPIGYSFGVAQSWKMFAPFPAKDDGWFVIPGTLQGGRQVDLMPVTRGDFDLHEVSWEKPRYVSSTDKNEHWRKYLQSIRKEKNADQRLHLGRYVCREWNARHAGAEQLETLQITFMREDSLPDYQRVAPRKVVLRDHRCL